MANNKFDVTILIQHEGCGWAAQCLEYDIAAQGDSIRQATENFEHTFVGQVILDLRQGKQPLEGFGIAPKDYWERYRTADRLAGDYEPFYIPEELLPIPQKILARASERRVA